MQRLTWQGRIGGGHGRSSAAREGKEEEEHQNLHQKALDPLALHACADFLDAAHSMDFSPAKPGIQSATTTRASSCTKISPPTNSTRSFYISRQSALKPPKFLVRPIRANLQLAQCSSVNESCVYLCNSFSEICLRREINHPTAHSVISYSLNLKNFAAVQFSK